MRAHSSRRFEKAGWRGHPENTRRQGRRGGGAGGDCERAAAGDHRPWFQARKSATPMATNAVLDLSALNAVTAYEPNELIITVQAGAPLADVHVADRFQEPAVRLRADGYRAAARYSPDAGTIGGMIAAGLAGPRRIKAGGARDHLLGAHAVSGFGDSFKTGGKVVKNVTGYDLCKLLAGSWGTLAVMTEVTLKVMPRPESRAHAGAARPRRPHRQSRHDRGARFALRRLGARRMCRPPRCGRGRRARPARLAARGGHADPARGHRRPRPPIGRPRSPARWRRSASRRDRWKMRPRPRSGTRSATSLPFAADGTARRPGRSGGSSVRRPAGGALGQALARETGGEVIYDWGGGLIWAALPPKPDAQARAGAHARRCRRRPRHAAARRRGRAAPGRRVPSAGARACRA